VRLANQAERGGGERRKETTKISMATRRKDKKYAKHVHELNNNPGKGGMTARENRHKGDKSEPDSGLRSSA